MAFWGLLWCGRMLAWEGVLRAPSGLLAAASVTNSVVSENAYGAEGHEGVRVDSLGGRKQRDAWCRQQAGPGRGHSISSGRHGPLPLFKPPQTASAFWRAVLTMGRGSV